MILLDPPLDPPSVEGQLVLKSHGRVNQALQTKIGNEGLDSDVGFHLIGDRFDGPINRLNVIQGNGKPVNGLKNLNTSAYAKLENIWQKELAAGNQVRVKIEPAYSGGTIRPDKFNIEYQIRVNGVDQNPIQIFFKNKAGQ